MLAVTSFHSHWNMGWGMEGKTAFWLFLGVWGSFSPIFQRSKHSPEKVNTLLKVTQFSCIIVIDVLSLDLFQKGFKEP